MATSSRTCATRFAGSRRTPGFTLLALVTLALGIGANTALFSVVHAVLLKPLPFAEPERLSAVWSRHTSTERYPFSLPEFCDYRDRNRTLEAFAGFANWSGILGGDGAAERLPGLRVSGNFFDMLGAAAGGRPDARPGRRHPGEREGRGAGPRPLAAALRRRSRRGGAPVTLNGEAFTVVGVLGRDFLFPVRDIELAIPLAPDQDPWRHNRESTNFIRVIGRVRAGVTPARSAAELDGIGRAAAAGVPGQLRAQEGVLVVPYREELTRSFRQTLSMLLAAVALLLLIACAEPREPHAGAGHAPAARSWPSAGPWARARAGSRGSCWSRAASWPSAGAALGVAARRVGRARSRGAEPDRDAAGPGDRHQPPRAALHARGRGRSRGARLRAVAGLARGARGPERGPASPRAAAARAAPTAAARGG